jgi:hypothetical protein
VIRFYVPINQVSIMTRVGETGMSVTENPQVHQPDGDVKNLWRSKTSRLPLREHRSTWTARGVIGSSEGLDRRETHRASDTSKYRPSARRLLLEYLQESAHSVYGPDWHARVETS